ncbi:hypothetical protein SAMN04487949_2170 [Halogranum gelatinilyticum]|uniref:Uncharacterized protein n=1 Tax=Halogranum gelatinilyticum TaxID=660521 RepID=A0A1G9UFI0_9EURY|nr:hypothetical protein [Halogranum gelatinilyticum]SDM58691.1 hypothetical protein SAMN04487949_2170 [Halogranum gelatinilyticum]
MKFKLVPTAPDSLDFVADAQRAVPLVPGTEDDCCARLMRRLDLPSRDVARTWLTFLRALELAEETPSGFKRLRTEPTADHLRDAIQRRVYGAENVLAALEDATEHGDSLTADAAFEAFKERVPVWEHYKNPGEWERVWAERVGDILEWLVLVNLAEETENGYVVADD